jgi:hypothetical protein
MFANSSKTMNRDEVVPQSMDLCRKESDSSRFPLFRGVTSFFPTGHSPYKVRHARKSLQFCTNSTRIRLQAPAQPRPAPVLCEEEGKADDG